MGGGKRVERVERVKRVGGRNRNRNRNRNIYFSKPTITIWYSCNIIR